MRLARTAALILLPVAAALAVFQATVWLGGSVPAAVLAAAVSYGAAAPVLAGLLDRRASGGVVR